MTTAANAPGTTDPVIRVDGVNHYFGEGEIRKQVLFDNHLRIGAGELVIMTGPSGSGKTTLLTLCGALRSLQEGSLSVLGQELTGMGKRQLVDVRRGMGFIFQMHNLFDSLTALENVRMSMQLHSRYSQKQMRELGSALLDRLGIGERIHYKPRALSGGQRQRVAIARALVNRPKLILADEPTAALDGESSGEVIKLLKELAAEEGSTILMVTHDARILDAADRIVNMVDGHIASDVGVQGALELCQLLQASTVFSQLTPAAILDVSERFTSESHPEGTVMFEQGDPGDRFYLIGSGQVGVVIDGAEAASLAAGEFFGETSLMTGEPRNATIVCSEDVELFSLAGDEFRRTLETSETFKEQLCKVAFQRGR